MAITTLDGAIAGMRPPQSFHKASATAEGAGTFHSLFLTAGLPGAGSTPPAYSAGSGYTCSRTTTGAIPYTNPTGGALSYLARIAASGATAGTLILYDRLWTCSGFVTNSTSLQSITTPGSIPARDRNASTDGDGVELWGEVYTAPGTTTATWTATYTDSAGNTGQTSTYTHPANAESVGQMLYFPLAAGDVGVRAPEAFQCSVSSGSAGNVGFTLLRRIAELPISQVNVAAFVDLVSAGMPQIYDDSCLALMVHCSATNTGIFLGNLVYTQG